MHRGAKTFDVSIGGRFVWGSTNLVYHKQTADLLEQAALEVWALVGQYLQGAAMYAKDPINEDLCNRGGFLISHRKQFDPFSEVIYYG